MTTFNRWGRPALLAACAATGLMLAAGTPARAIEDDGRGSTLDTFMNMFGMGDKDEEPAIQYRERAPLALPPSAANKNLPQPRQGAATSTAAWPQDQEIVRARKKAAEGRVQMDADRIETARELKQAGRLAPNGDYKGGPPVECNNMDPFDKSSCSPGTYWGKLAETPATEQTPKVGEEPNREYLTQPPKGYMKQTQSVKATFEPHQNVDEDPRSFYWDKNKKRDE